MEDTTVGLVDPTLPPLGEEQEVEVVEPRKIEDPWHSRPLDVHRWSDHPEAVSIVTTVWNDHFSHLDNNGRSGPKPKQSFKYQLRVLILDLYVAWLEDPSLCIGVSMSENAWFAGSRYNKLGISKKILLLIQALADSGFIDLAKGSWGGKKALTNRTTRIRAADPLRELFSKAKMDRDDVQQVEGQECIVLKANDGDGSALVNYEETAATTEMRRDLQAYNLLLTQTFIDIPTLADPKIERQDERGRANPVHIDHHHQFTRRIFSRGDWGCNGRFYGPWWQQIGSELRSEIFISDTPTVEVDFKGMHVAILSAQRGVEVEGDPYALPAGLIPDAGEALQRTLVKKLVLTALNARTTKAAFSSFRDGFPKGHMAKALTNADLQVVLSACTKKHPHLADCLCADLGIGLMNLDAQIASRVLRYFTRRGIPVLSVHDSFIVDYTHVGLLKRVMAVAARAVVSKALPMEAKGQGLDEIGDDPDVLLDFQTWRQTERCRGYLGRLSRWEERTGREVLPSKL